MPGKILMQTRKEILESIEKTEKDFSFEEMKHKLEALKELMEVILFDGEIILSKLQEELVFEFISGKTVGYGVIKKIREIYITSESLNFIDDIEERRKIVRLAETMENALVFEDVYLMI